LHSHIALPIDLDQEPLFTDGGIRDFGEKCSEEKRKAPTAVIWRADRFLSPKSQWWKSDDWRHGGTSNSTDPPQFVIRFSNQSGFQKDGGRLSKI
jgi:hypothetical protein